MTHWRKSPRAIEQTPRKKRRKDSEKSNDRINPNIYPEISIMRTNAHVSIVKQAREREPIQVTNSINNDVNTPAA